MARSSSDADTCNAAEHLGSNLFEHMLLNPMQYAGSTIASMAKTAMAEERKALSRGDEVNAAYYRGFLKRCD